MAEMPAKEEGMERVGSGMHLLAGICPPNYSSS